MMRLDHLEPLVHHGRGIDRDLGAHVPVRMGDRLLRRDRGHPSARSMVRNGPPTRSGSAFRPRPGARSRKPGRSHCARNPPAAARRRCADLAPSSARRRRPGIPCWPRRRRAPAHRRQRRRQAGRADDGGHDPVAGRSAAAIRASGPAATSMPVPASALQIGVAGRIGRWRPFPAVNARLPASTSTLLQAGQRDDVVAHPGSRSIRSIVLQPTEPVAPRIVTAGARGTGAGRTGIDLRPWNAPPDSDDDKAGDRRQAWPSSRSRTPPCPGISRRNVLDPEMALSDGIPIRSPIWATTARQQAAPRQRQ